jgi:hypothetical protein
MIITQRIVFFLGKGNVRTLFCFFYECALGLWSEDFIYFKDNEIATGIPSINTATDMLKYFIAVKYQSEFINKIIMSKIVNKYDATFR